MNKDNDSILVYLDYNVIRYLEDKTVTIEQIKQRLNTTKEIVFPFTASHIQEIDNIADSNPERDRIIQDRVSFINTLSNTHCLHTELEEPDTIYLSGRDAFEVLETIREVPFAKSAMKLLSNFVNESQRKSVRELLGVDSKELNNYSIPQVLEHLEKFAGNSGMTFVQFMAKVKSFNPSSHTFGFNNDVAGIFEMLDLIGYWKDTYKENSNYARLWDSSHCAYASVCDYFISNDRNTCNKTQVVYSMYNIKTEVMLWR